MNNEKLAKGFDKLIREYSKDIYGDENALLMGQYAAMYHALSQSRQQGRMEMAEEIEKGLEDYADKMIEDKSFNRMWFKSHIHLGIESLTPPTINK